MITGGFPVIPSCFQFSKFNKIFFKKYWTLQLLW